MSELRNASAIPAASATEALPAATPEDCDPAIPKAASSSGRRSSVAYSSGRFDCRKFK